MGNLREDLRKQKLGLKIECFQEEGIILHDSSHQSVLSLEGKGQLSKAKTAVVKEVTVPHVS